MGSFHRGPPVRRGRGALLHRLRPRAVAVQGQGDRVLSLGHPHGRLRQDDGRRREPTRRRQDRGDGPRARLQPQARVGALSDRVRGPRDELRPRRGADGARLHDLGQARGAGRRRSRGRGRRGGAGRDQGGRQDPGRGRPRRPVLGRGAGARPGGARPQARAEGRRSGRGAYARGDAAEGGGARSLRRRAGLLGPRRAAVGLGPGQDRGRGAGWAGREGRAQGRRSRRLARGQARRVVGRFRRRDQQARGSADGDRDQARRADADVVGDAGADRSRGQGADRRQPLDGSGRRCRVRPLQPGHRPLGRHAENLGVDVPDGQGHVQAHHGAACAVQYRRPDPDRHGGGPAGARRGSSISRSSRR